LTCCSRPCRPHLSHLPAGYDYLRQRRPRSELRRRPLVADRGGVGSRVQRVARAGFLLGQARHRACWM